jgi:hypothetical protein
VRKMLFLCACLCFVLWSAAGFAFPEAAPLLHDPSGAAGKEWGSVHGGSDALIPYEITPYTNEFYDRKIDGFGFADRFFDDDWKDPLLEGKRESYLMKGDRLFLETIPLLQVIYSYSAGELSEVTMLFKGEENYQSVEQYCLQIFGESPATRCPPTFGAVGRLRTDRFWAGEKTLIHLRWDHILFTDKTFGFLQFRSRRHME